MTSSTSATLFDEAYFQHGCGPIPYERRAEWLDRFAMIAERIIQEVRPQSVLDAGCAMGFLVEALRDRGVEAYGVDVSDYAIARVREDIKPHCWVGSLVDPLPERYDLIVCIEVLEHLPKAESERAVERLCQASDDILLSSSPDDYRELTHFNVQPPEYWTSLFALQGFWRDVDFNGSFITAWTMRFRKSNELPHRIVASYERKLWLLSQQTSTLRNLAQEAQGEAREHEQAFQLLRTQVADKDQAIQALTSQVANKDHAIQALEEQAASERRESQRLEWELRVVTQDRDSLRHRLQTIEQRLSWQLLQRAWRLQLRLAPPGSRQGLAWLALTRTTRRLLGRPSLIAATIEQQGAITRDRHLELPFDAYETWSRRCEALRYVPARAAEEIARFTRTPVISIVMPVYNTPEAILRRAIESVCNQYYPHWELCICDDASPAEHIRELLDDYVARDERIKVTCSETNGGIVIASNNALGLATGEFVGLLDHDDELTPDALYEVTRVLQDVDADLVYSDEDKIDHDGRRRDPFFKPAWSPDLLLSCMYTGHFSVYRKRLIDQVGGFRHELDGSQDYDLALRITEQSRKIVHIPKILYHWRQMHGSAALNAEAKPYAYLAGQKAITDALARRGIVGEVGRAVAAGYYEVRRAIQHAGRVSIILLARGDATALRRCIASIESTTNYPDYEIIIAPENQHSMTHEYPWETPHQVIRIADSHNHSRLLNAAAQRASGEYLAFLHEDTEVLVADWLTALAEHAQRPEVGVVGGKLVYPDDRIQHAGIILGLGGVADYSQKFAEGPNGFGYHNFPNVSRNYSAVTGACMMIRRELFNACGGLNEHDVPVHFNDLDLCLRLRQEGYLIVYTPHALLRHYEPVSGRTTVNPQAEAYMVTTWGNDLREDPYYNPNLSLAGGGFTLDEAGADALRCLYTQPVATEVVGPVTQHCAIGQAFQAGENDVCALGLRFGTNRTTCSGTIRLHLRESPHFRTDLTVVEAEACDIRDNEYFLFAFDPIPDSVGRSFYFFIEPCSDAVTNDLQVWKSVRTDPTVGAYYRNHLVQTGTLTFRVYALSRAFRAVDYRIGDDGGHASRD